MNQAIIKNLQDGEAWVKKNRALWEAPGIVSLGGPMGAGKTQLVRWILKELGSDEASSPTYAIHHRYIVKGRNIDHFDLYRLICHTELEETGFSDIVRESDNLVFIEWADRLDPSAIPSRRKIQINIEPDASGARKISW